MKTLLKSLTASLVLAFAGTASAASGGFNQGAIKGMEDVLILNPLSRMVLAGANDNALFLEALRLQEYFIKVGRGGSGFLVTSESGLNKATGKHILNAPDLEITLQKFQPDPKAWGRLNGAQVIIDAWPDDLRCVIKMDLTNPEKEAHERDILTSEKRVDICRTGTFPGSNERQQHLDPKLGVSKRVASAVRMVQQVKEDVRRATKFGFVLTLGDDNPFNTGAATPNVFKVGNEFAIPFTGTGFMRDLRYIKNKAGMSEDDATWAHCEISLVENYRDSVQLNRSMLMKGDVVQTCLAFAGYAGFKIPTGIVVRDLGQLNPKKQALGAVLVLNKPFKLRPQQTDEGLLVAGIRLEPIGWHIIDSNLMSTITSNIIPRNAAAAFTYLSYEECVGHYVSHWNGISLSGVNKDIQEKGAQACRGKDVKARMDAKGIKHEEASKQIAQEEISKW